MLGDGHQFGVNLSYAVQESPDGLAQAFIIGEEFIGDDSVAMVLGDNIFAGHGLTKRLHAAVEMQNPEKVLLSSVIMWMIRSVSVLWNSTTTEKRFPSKKTCTSEEQLLRDRSVFYDNKVVEYAKNLKPSARGELEITDLNRIYLEEGQLNVELLGQGFTWLDTGTHESLVDATNFVKTHGNSPAQKNLRVWKKSLT